MLKTSSFKIQVNCPGCNTYHALSGVHTQETCQNCGRVISLSEIFRGRLFGSADIVKYMNSYISGTVQLMGGGAVNDAGAYKMTYSSRPAYCEECQKIADEKDIVDSINANKPYICPSCSHAMPVKPADDFLKKLHPKAIGTINDSEGADLGSKKANEKEQMIVYTCMTCGAGLQIRDKSSRMVRCPYCDNENYLPDAIWNKLHPDKEVDPFFVILDLDGADSKAGLDYFLTMPMTRIYEKHFGNFINEYFETPFVSDSFNVWLKVFLSAESKAQTGPGFDIEGLQRQFYRQMSAGSIPAELKLTACSYGRNIPDELQLKFAKDIDDSIRLALAGNPDINKDCVKTLQNDSNAQVSEAAKKHKTGFLKGLFG